MAEGTPSEAPIRRVALLSTGEELVRGAIADTNAPWIARTLKRLGALVVEARQVGDGRAAIAAAALELSRRCDLLVVTGGIGPTADDRTREALADAAGVAVREDVAALAQVEAYFARFRRTASASNRRQALLPEGACVVVNPIGSAPGFALQIGGALVVALPGVPIEMKRMVEEWLVPRVRARNGAAAFEERLLQVVGLAESVVGERIDAWMRADAPLVSVTVTASRVTICASDAADASGRARLDGCTQGMRTALGDHVFAEGDVTLAEHVVGRLRERHLTVALAESCTGGLLAARLTEVPGASAFLERAYVTYSNQSKIDLLGVTPRALEESGAVSESVARAMAEGARTQAGTDIGIAITGIAGPDGGSPEKPVGLVFVALDGAGLAGVRRAHFPGSRERVRFQATQAALEMLRRGLLGLHPL